jgi:hypothetical protein
MANSNIPKRLLSIPKSLFLGNFWVAYPFFQMDEWKNQRNANVPQALIELYASVTSKSNEESPNLKQYAENTAKFSNALVDSFTQKKPMIKDEPIQNLPHNFTFNLQQIDQFLNKRIFFYLNPNSKHFPTIQLLQAEHAFKMLKEILTKLNLNSLMTDEFSWLFRGAIYWQNLALESLLRSICSFQSYFDITEHDLSEIVKKINWSNAIENSEMEMLETDWKLVNKFSRYPFEDKDLISKTHELILQAEFLRQNPHYGIGFIPVHNENSLSNQLNYIPISYKELHVDQLLKKLDILLQGAWSFLSHKVIPQLEIEYKNNVEGK